jgi:hypothetical protein
MSLESTRRALYLSQRAIGSYQAAQRGPKPLCKRLVRRTVTRQLMKPYGKLWRAL